MAASSLKCISAMQFCKDTARPIPQEDLDRGVRYTTHALLKAAQRLDLVQVPRPWQEDVFLVAGQQIQGLAKVPVLTLVAPVNLPSVCRSRVSLCIRI